ncbi:MAG TPA: hypothetical protein VFR07_12395 [Mycobacteriales bacterium]|nr:hypothetical protein [Mycobacteriales bacterium]
MAALIAVLALLPTAVRALPAGDSALSAEQLRDRVRASASVGWSGTSESRSGLALPDVRDLGDLPALLGGTVRTRVWWRDPGSWRVDEQRLTGEQDVIVDGGVTTTWTSADQAVEQLMGELPVRLPRAADLIAPVLGRRLAGSPDTVLSRLPSRRVAGVSAAGLRLVPRDPASSTVASVDMWADPDTGLPLQVELRAAGQERPVLTTLLLDLDRRAPEPERMLFSYPRGATVAFDEAPDIAAQVDRAVPYILPRRLAGADRQVVPGLEQVRGVGTYGEGLSAFAVVPLPRDVADRLTARLAAAGGPRLSTPLVNALVGTTPRRTYLLVGSVPQEVLDRAFAELERNPPPRTGR